MKTKTMYVMMGLIACVGLYVSSSLFLGYLPYMEYQLLKVVASGAMTLVFLIVIGWLMNAYRKEE